MFYGLDLVFIGMKKSQLIPDLFQGSTLLIFQRCLLFFQYRHFVVPVLFPLQLFLSAL